MFSYQIKAPLFGVNGYDVYLRQGGMLNGVIRNISTLEAAHCIGFNRSLAAAVEMARLEKML